MDPTRRKVLKWTTPVVTVIVLPVHAQLSPVPPVGPVAPLPPECVTDGVIISPDCERDGGLDRLP
ncbi:MAG: hypothetical protein ACYSUL_14115 [Planctomycetota bacterium]|jgi:hypothetical protein